jgi:cytochrome P450
MPSTLILLDFVSAAIGLYLVKKYFERPAPPAPYPPGPKGLPLLGNALEFPSSREWETFAKWGQQYGDMMSVDVMGQRMVVLNSAQIASEMLEGKGAIYSNRPTLPMGGELVGWKNTLVLIPQGERHRQYRRLFHKLIGTSVSMQQFLPAEEEETHKFLRRVLAKPADLQSHVRQ